jgi:hypothetical protein
MSEAANNERLSIYIDDAISTILEVKLNRIVPPTLQTMVNNKFNEAPTWFTSEMNNIKSGLTDLETRMNSKLAVLEASLNTKLAVLEASIDTLDYRYLCLFNYQRRMGAHEAISVPFLDREINQEELPPILSVENIDRLTKEQCQNYLMGYKVQFHPNETVKLKERLRDAVGLMASHDLNYQFSTFSHN